MRSDMAKVVVERPRGGPRLKGPKSYLRKLQRIAMEEWPKQEGVARAWSGQSKWLSEHLGPLRRYLWKQVGRPWDKVYSEIAKHIRLDSAVQSHVLDHLDDFVEMHVRLVDGQPFAIGSCGERQVRPHQLYVCPKTGLLRAVKQKQRVRECKRIDVSKQLQYHRISGIWHEVVLRSIPQDAERCFDAVLGKPVAQFLRGEATSKYGFAAYALSKRPLTQNELKAFQSRMKKHR